MTTTVKNLPASTLKRIKAIKRKDELRRQQKWQQQKQAAIRKQYSESLIRKALINGR